jgi:hypothetical protein
MGIVDDLLAHPGVYVGLDHARRHSETGAARIEVKPLPGGGGVSLDYEIFNIAHPDHIRGHVEHEVIGRTADGRTVMVVAHSNGGPTIEVLHETEPGTFVPSGATAYPMKVVVTMTEPGKLRHAWWYGSPGEEPQENDVAEVTLTT